MWSESNAKGQDATSTAEAGKSYPSMKAATFIGCVVLSALCAAPRAHAADWVPQTQLPPFLQHRNWCLDRDNSFEAKRFKLEVGNCRSLVGHNWSPDGNRTPGAWLTFDGSKWCQITSIKRSPYPKNEMWWLKGGCFDVTRQSYVADFRFYVMEDDGEPTLVMLRPPYPFDGKPIPPPE